MGGKLVRDRIPEIMVATGGSPSVVTLDEIGYIAALRTKLTEEVAEYFLAEDAKASLTELLDVVEVALALAEQLGIERTQFLDVLTNRRVERGAYAKRLFLIDH